MAFDNVPLFFIFESSHVNRRTLAVKEREKVTFNRIGWIESSHVTSEILETSVVV